MDVFRSFWNRRGAAPGGAATSSGRPAGCREENSSVLLQSLKANSQQQKYLDDPDKIPTYYVFQSNMVTDEDLLPGMLRNLEVDKRLTLPTRTHIRFLITATDVIHSWAVPALGIKADAIPGRLQRINTFIQREGVFYGQCSELCGALHGFMPIVIEAVSPETYAAHAKKWYKDWELVFKWQLGHSWTTRPESDNRSHIPHNCVLSSLVRAQNSYVEWEMREEGGQAREDVGAHTRQLLLKNSIQRKILRFRGDHSFCGKVANWDGVVSHGEALREGFQCLQSVASYDGMTATASHEGSTSSVESWTKRDRKRSAGNNK
uniref:Cytochrome c oxidase polypeptide II n=1 Tax=Toxoplasma gondii TaxID=5811 RepID=Q9TAP1_TOXGO|nr:cytochrome oxidase subunit II [Toxoplasma gondii]